MTDATERRLAGLLAQISEMLDSRLPQEGVKPSGLSMWQFWVVIGTMLFYAGAAWWQGNSNTEAIAVNSKHISENGESLAHHMQWEFEHELKAKDAQIEALKARK